LQRVTITGKRSGAIGERRGSKKLEKAGIRKRKKSRRRTKAKVAPVDWIIPGVRVNRQAKMASQIGWKQWGSAWVKKYTEREVIPGKRMTCGKEERENTDLGKNRVKK